MTMIDVFEDFYRHLSEDVKFSERDIGTIAIKYVAKTYDCSLEGHERVEDSTYEDAHFIDILMMLFLYHENAFEDFNWSTQEIGSWITKTQVMMTDICPNLDLSKLYEVIDKLFTIEGSEVSTMDIAQLFSAKNVLALDSVPYLGPTGYEYGKW